MIFLEKIFKKNFFFFISVFGLFGLSPVFSIAHINKYVSKMYVNMPQTLAYDFSQNGADHNFGHFIEFHIP